MRPLNDKWQSVVDSISEWRTDSIGMQSTFFEKHVNLDLRNNTKVAVIISDAMRYEVGEELANRIESQGHLKAEIDAMLGMLPSYTQLGMAALLPNSSLEIRSDGNVLADGLSTLGTENRTKVLAAGVQGGAKAMPDAEIRGMTKEERRALFRESQVVYIYHNQIDVTGDRTSEDRVVDAAETTLDDLVNLVKMLRTANFIRILITADHGFLYQYQALDESDFTGSEIVGSQIFTSNRRFVVGKGLTPSPGLKHFTASQAGLSGDYEIQLAKSINRLRVKGASSRYVHGGASLQEVIIPVVTVTQEYGEDTDVRSVKVDRINPGSNRITTGQVSVTFYQVEPVSPRVVGRKLRAGIFAEDGTLISSLHTLQFNFESEDPRDREISISIQLSAEYEKYNRQNVNLRLDELIPDTEKYVKYEEWAYQLDKAHFALF
ncbi:MAG: BREX-1 system phosphatase PglZ type A [Smithella sp.]